MAKRPKTPSGRVIGRERKVVRRTLDDDDKGAKRAIVGRSYESQRELEDDFTAFDKWASPRVRRVLDPGYENDKLKGEAEMSLEQARALDDEVRARRKLKGAAVAQLKAERRLALDAAVNGYEYVVADCDMVADDEALEIAFVDRKTGLEVDRRAMTDGERQTSLAGVGANADSGKGAPATAH